MLPLKVVAHLTDGHLIKGYSDLLVSTEWDRLENDHPASVPSELTVRLVESDQSITIPMKSLKALFFVRTFEGEHTYNEVKFFEGHPQTEGLWVRMIFKDGECTEGVVRNSIRFLIQPGFLLRPPDLQSNNEIVYVLKDALAAFSVMGVKYNY